MPTSAKRRFASGARQSYPSSSRARSLLQLDRRRIGGRGHAPAHARRGSTLQIGETARAVGHVVIVGTAASRRDHVGPWHLHYNLGVWLPRVARHEAQAASTIGDLLAVGTYR